MSDPVWYRSLYWRIAFGFIAMLAILLLAQGLLFLWLTDRFFGAAPVRRHSLRELVAAEVGDRTRSSVRTSISRHSSAIGSRTSISRSRRADRRPARVESPTAAAEFGVWTRRELAAAGTWRAARRSGARPAGECRRGAVRPAANARPGGSGEGRTPEVPSIVIRRRRRWASSRCRQSAAGIGRAA